jgi:hypothetical protein
MKLKKLLVITFALALTACATIDGAFKTRHYSTTRSNLDAEARQLSESQRSRLNSAPELIILKSKVWFEQMDRMPMSYVIHTDFPDDKEKVSIKKYYEYNIGFNSENKDLLRKWNFPAEDILDLNFEAQQNLLLELYLGKIAYGQYSVKRREIFNISRQALSNRIREVNLNISAQQSIAMQNFSTYLQNQQLINTLNAPVRIAPFSCSRMGSSVNCY